MFRDFLYMGVWVLRCCGLCVGGVLGIASGLCVFSLLDDEEIAIVGKDIE